MFIAKQAWLSLKRQPARALLLVLVFTVAFCSELTGQTLLSSARAQREVVLGQIGAQIDLTKAADEEAAPLFTQDIFDLLAGQDHVLGCNQRTSEFATALNFESCKDYTGTDPATLPMAPDEDAGREKWVVLECNTDTRFSKAFLRGLARLTEGAFATEQAPGAVISQQLARQEGLKVGDTLEFESIYDTEKHISISVTGIYETEEYFFTTDEHGYGKGVFSFSPYNRIYVDWGSYESLNPVDRETLPIEVHVDSRENVDPVGQTLKKLDLDWNQYLLVNTTATRYNSEASPIEATISSTELVLGFLRVFCSLMIVLATCIWAERSWYESGIYLALGASKWYALFQQLVTAVFAAIPALVLALLLSGGLAEELLTLMQQFQLADKDLIMAYYSGAELSVDVVVALPALEVYLSFGLRSALSILLACILPGCSVLRLKPREILSSE